MTDREQTFAERFEGPGWHTQREIWEARCPSLLERTDSLEEALRDFAQILPPDRWRLLRPETNRVLKTIYAEPK